MDRVIPKKTWTSKRIITISIVAGIVLLIASSYYFTRGGNKLDVETDRITISEVTKGKFQENIPVNGVVFPQTTIYLDAIEGGRVEEKYVDDGTMMKKESLFSLIQYRSSDDHDEPAKHVYNTLNTNAD